MQAIRCLGSAAWAPPPVAPRPRCTTIQTRAAAQPGAAEPTPQQAAADSMDVSGTVVPTTFRVSMDSSDNDDARTTLRVLFISESGVCRAPLAAAAFAAAIDRRGLGPAVQASAAACRDYNVGEDVDPAAAAAASAREWAFPQENGAPYAVRLFTPASDLQNQDLILVMDKFTAADVLREASVFDTIYMEAGFSGKVRQLGEFHPNGGGSGAGGEGLQIEDALYGNLGGIEEFEAVEAVAEVIEASCEGMGEWLEGLAAGGEGGEGLRPAVASWLQTAGGVDWLRPPLLSPR